MIICGGARQEHVDPKLKKKLIQARNRRNQLIFQFARVHQAEHRRITEEELEALTNRAPEPTRKQKEEQDQVWSEKVQKVRDRLTNKKRDARDRWNRFAGTEGGGGMGR